MSAITLESVISKEIISEFSQKASRTIIWRECSDWLGEPRTFEAMRVFDRLGRGKALSPSVKANSNLRTLACEWWRNLRKSPEASTA